MKKIFFLILIFSASLFAQRGRLIPNPLKNIPRWARTEFKAHNLDRKYIITFKNYPHFYHGDFNCDNRKDYVLQITEKETGKSGLVFLFGKKTQTISTTYSIIGAGNRIGKAGDDFKWVDKWTLQTDVKCDEIFLSSNKSKNGIVKWDGKSFDFKSTH
ncbi:MAG: hypothetical protein HY964_07020 [Ignavibacteriales bacterium]|nr:hypothetical protein [Ignavibacteriales bacterium]